MSPFALCIALWETRFYQDHARKIQNIRWSGSFGYPSSLRSKIQWNLNKVQNRNNESCFTKISYQQGLIELDWETHSEREDRGTGEDEEAVCVCVCVKPLAQPLLTSRLYLSAERGNLPAARLRSPPAAPSEVICHFRPIFTWLLRQKRSDTEVARSDRNVDATQTLYTHRLKMRSGLKREG